MRLKPLLRAKRTGWRESRQVDPPAQKPVVPPPKCPSGRAAASIEATKKPLERGFSLKRMKGLEPSTFCMASRADGRDD